MSLNFRKNGDFNNNFLAKNIFANDSQHKRCSMAFVKFNFVTEQNWQNS